MDIQAAIFKGFSSFINFTFVTRKSENKPPVSNSKAKKKSLTIELVTRSESFYFLTSSQLLAV